MRAPALLLVAVALFAMVVRTTATPLSQELLRIEQLTTGTLVSLQELGAAGKPIRVELTFKLGTFVPRKGVHLALGVGDLSRYYNHGKAPIGEGVVIGASDICPDRQQISAVTESYYSGTTLEPLTCFSGIDQNKVYRLSVLVTPEYKVSYELFDGETKLYSGTRTWLGVHAWHTRGLFLVPVSDETTPGTYQLLKLTARTE